MLEDWFGFGVAAGVGLGVAVLVALAVETVMRLIAKRTAWARSLMVHARRPFWMLSILLGLWIGVRAPLQGIDWWAAVMRIFTIAVIATLAWLLIGFVRFLADLALEHNRIDVPDNRLARRLRTQTLIVKRLAIALIVVIAVGASLFTFDEVRALGASVLASAGIASIVAGLAAQSVLGNMFAGIQLVFSDALRVDDVIVAQGEWGRVGEITLSYVVLDLWDDRRLVLPCTYFTTTPYENWTRQGSELLGSVEFDLDWRVSPQRMREHLEQVLTETPLYDGRASVLQVTEATQGYVRVRILVTAHDAPTLYDLRCFVREAMVLWIQSVMPDAAPAQRVLVTEQAAGRPGRRGARQAAEQAGESGLFTGSASAEERASQFTHGTPRETRGGDDAVVEPATDEAAART
ncbi:mechanosensitive ion channel family protein [Demequina sp. SYSU T00039]|uniref:Mechanosensitive ion channel family protein n=1 Tax=Demequina lignilytica TaxID=3051663 RepID=A0AAW7M162_9MICO|nr:MULTISPECIES: mechanosensitive ion channel family protein [unclassified Demequina]MDN4478434.1 mechanosensitive ion channel family protein [Demequina sp. SYSU T00039-1]MDN4487059.1 mechanosensitive ion channel family protein [Demequina sp. SYSU T00039]